MVKSMSRYLSYLALAGLFVSATALAELRTDAKPFAARNLNPYITILGLPAMETGVIAPKGENQFALLFDLANNSARSSGGPQNIESITLDGETYRLALVWRRALAANFEVGVELPYIIHGPGVLDNFIEGWHDLFGLSNSQRDKAPSNTLDYRYQWNGSTLMGFEEANNGVGDLRLFASKAIVQSPERSIKATASLEFPTGNAKWLRGSGDADFSFFLSATDNKLLAQWDLTSFGQLGVLMIGQSMNNQNLRSTLRRDVALFGGFGVNWKYSEMIDLKAQLQSHTAMYKNFVTPMNAPSTLLTVGGTLYLSDNTMLDLAIGENLMTSTIPDFIVNVTLSSRY